jgi:hypothetical protein
VKEEMLAKFCGNIFEQFALREPKRRWEYCIKMHKGNRLLTGFNWHGIAYIGGPWYQ